MRNTTARSGGFAQAGEGSTLTAKPPTLPAKTPNPPRRDALMRESVTNATNSAKSGEGGEGFSYFYAYEKISAEDRNHSLESIEGNPSPPSPPSPPSFSPGIEPTLPLVAQWRASLETLAALPDGWEALRVASLRFIDTHWLGIALAEGWSTAELWSCFPTHRFEVMRRRCDCQGLVVGLAIGLGCSIRSIDAHEAVVSRKRTGAVLRLRRTLPGEAAAVLWWQVFDGAAQAVAA